MKRRRGRPRRDYSDDPDRVVAQFAIALQAAWDLSERMAIDLALAVLQGKPGSPSKVPRGAKAKAGPLVSYALPDQKSFKSRSADIRRKLKAGKLHPNAVVVIEIARRLLHSIPRA
jgi:hypothetical protein